MFGEEGESSGAGRTSDAGRLISRSIGQSIGRSIVVAINAGDQSTRIDFQLPGLAGHAAEQLSWPGRGWTSTFAPRKLQGETVEVELEAREGILIAVAPIR
jgi:hypothetical protein